MAVGSASFARHEPYQAALANLRLYFPHLYSRRAPCVNALNMIH